MLIIWNDSSLPNAGVAYYIRKEHHLARPDKGQLKGPAVEISGDHDEDLESDGRWLCQSNARTSCLWIEKCSIYLREVLTRRGNMAQVRCDTKICFVNG